MCKPSAMPQTLLRHNIVHAPCSCTVLQLLSQSAQLSDTATCSRTAAVVAWPSVQHIFPAHKTRMDCLRPPNVGRCSKHVLEKDWSHRFQLFYQVELYSIAHPWRSERRSPHTPPDFHLIGRCHVTRHLLSPSDFCTFAVGNDS